MKTVVLIPCYNEAKSIKAVIDDFRESMPDADIYVFDNNSTDGTDEIAASAGAIVRYESRQGKGNVIRTMFREIDADCYIMADGDNTYPASFAPVLQRLVLSGKADMAIGDRLSSSYFTENKRPFHNFGNRLVRGLINRLFKAKVNDIMTGARAFSRDFVKSFAVFSKGFEIETEMTIFALEHNFKIAEVPIEYRDRDADNPSKLSTYSDGYKVICERAAANPCGYPGACVAVIIDFELSDRIADCQALPGRAVANRQRSFADCKLWPRRRSRRRSPALRD